MTDLLWAVLWKLLDETWIDVPTKSLFENARCREKQSLLRETVIPASSSFVRFQRVDVKGYQIAMGPLIPRTFLS